MRSALLAPLLALVLAACAPATPEDRAALLGVWAPQDGSDLTIEFRDNGEFDFVYQVEPRITLRVGWRLKSKGSVEMLDHDGSLYKSCPYRIEGETLFIDDGSGAECLRSASAPAVRMAKRFKRLS